MFGKRVFTDTLPEGYGEASGQLISNMANCWGE